MSESKREPKKLPAVRLPGLTLDTLGLYFAALGLLRLLSRKWPQVRGCWRDGAFVVVAGPGDQNELIDHLMSLKPADLPSFEVTWENEAKAVAKNQNRREFIVADKLPTMPLLMLRSELAEERLRNFDAHLVVNRSSVGNPILKNPGGRRDPHKKWNTVINDALNGETGRNSLKATLLWVSEGKFKLDKWNAGTWFPTANKIYNYGSFSTKTSNAAPYVDNGIPSWSVVLAVTGFEYLVGSTSRKQGVNAKGRAAFPFVTTPAAASSEGDCGQSEAEFWAPVWMNPFAVNEIVSIFGRAKSEIGSRSATSAASFAGAIVARGVDHGIGEFARFALRYSTGEKTFEAIQTARVQISQKQSRVPTEAIVRLIAFRDRLPQERKVGKNWRFKGLQGPLDRALIDLAEAVGDGREGLQVERSIAVLDAMVGAFTRVDRNQSHRAANIAFERLPLEWLAWLAPLEGATSEFRLALALASLKPEIPREAKSLKERKRFPQAFLAYRFGATPRGRFWLMPKDRPLRAIWSSRSLVDNLCGLARRRLIETPATVIAPFHSNFPAPLTDAIAFLHGDTDDERLAQWLDRLSLFDWNDRAEHQSTLGKALDKAVNQKIEWSPTAALYAFYRPLVHDELMRGIISGNRSWKRKPQEPLWATSSRFSPIVAALEHGDSSAAWANARSAFHANKVPVAHFDNPDLFRIPDSRRLLAALIVPAEISGIYSYFRTHWQSPAPPETRSIAD